MAIIYSDTSKEIHIFNDQISYIIQILDNGELGNLYYGKKLIIRRIFHIFWREDSAHWQSTQRKTITL